MLNPHMAAAPAPLHPPPVQPPLLYQHVRLLGLDARPELNGVCGIAYGYDYNAGRYLVALDGGAGNARVRPEHLMNLSRSSATAPVDAFRWQQWSVAERPAAAARLQRLLLQRKRPSRWAQLRGVAALAEHTPHAHRDSVYVGYTGETRERGEPHGRGCMKYQTGHVYEGQFRKGECEGHGTLLFPDGQVFEGEFKGGKRHGKGMVCFSNGNTMVGIWQEGTMVSHELLDAGAPASACATAKSSASAAFAAAFAGPSYAGRGFAAPSAHAGGGSSADARLLRKTPANVVSAMAAEAAATKKAVEAAAKKAQSSGLAPNITEAAADFVRVEAGSLGSRLRGTPLEELLDPRFIEGELRPFIMERLFAQPASVLPPDKAERFNTLAYRALR